MTVGGHPYKNLPDYAFWSRSVSGLAMANVDPVVGGPKFIERQHKIATAGSCFAQHLSRKLVQLGYNYFVSEKAHPIVDEPTALKNQYGIFSARFGNIYTARQLLQLARRAYGKLSPKEKYWKKENRFLDPLRPAAQPGGYATLAELEADRLRHLQAVRTMFESLDVFIFTLGLTEAWIGREDGAVYPVCPGVAGGEFDDAKYAFHNFSYEECVADVREFIKFLGSVNPKFKMVLTVSPVALVATAEERHVLVSTTYSKSVLRVVADVVSREFDNVFYFPSYEIIMGQHARGAYIQDDLREVREEGVNHVMRVFQKHFLREEAPEAGKEAASPPPPAAPEKTQNIASELVQVECEERLLDDKMKA